MSACRDCKHWTRFDLHPDALSERTELAERLDSATWDSNSHLPEGLDREWGICARPTEKGAPMFTVDASGYYSSLSTLATFSCSEFGGR